MRLWTGDDQNSHFEEGVIDLEPGADGDFLSDKVSVTSTSFQETAAGGVLAWHTAPVRQLVVTLSGTLEFEMRSGRQFRLAPGDILLAEDTVGGGHTWKLIDEQPWRRVYIVLAPDVAVPFKPAHFGEASGEKG
ncbi:MAG: hypothetical protein KDI33_18805 [Halioglobus sp.]|nr:hypothetical protein [Halioglobus sp.]